MRYALANNNSGDWYIIPAHMSNNWNNWLGSKDWEMGITPSYAQYLTYQLHGLTFENPRDG